MGVWWGGHRKSPSKLHISNHVSRSQNDESVVHLSEEVIEEEIEMMECPEQSL